MWKLRTLEEVVAEDAETLVQIVTAEMVRQNLAGNPKPIAAQSTALAQNGQRITLRLEVQPPPAKASRAEVNN